MTRKQSFERIFVRRLSFVAHAIVVGLFAQGFVPASAAPSTTVVVAIAPAVTVVGEPVVDVTPGPVPDTKPAAPRGRFPDPLADLAAYALDALKTNASGGSLSTTALSVFSPTVGSPLSALTASGAGWSSAIVDTVDVSTLLNGAVAVNPANAARANITVADVSARYPAALAQLANVVSTRVKGSNASSLLQVWLNTDPRRMSVVLTAMSQVGTYYRWAGNQPGGFDCSGLTSYAWSAAGVKIPRTSSDQIAAATPKPAKELKPGDLVWRPGHVGMYLGVGEAMVQSSQSGKPVEVTQWGRVSRMGSPLG